MEKLYATLNKKYGTAVSVASQQKQLNSIPTGILSLDYELGVGGWQRGFVHSVYGPRDIGKSTLAGLGAIREAQKLGIACAMVAMEPGQDPVWMRRHGVDPDLLLMTRPRHGEMAFEMLLEIVDSGEIGLVVFDSIGAVISKKEMEADAASRVGGQAGLITRGVKAVVPVAYQTDTCVLFINQIRDNMASPHGGVKMPGGHALEHGSQTIVRLRGGKPINEKIDGDDVTVGNEVTAIIERNKANEGSKRKANFTFYTAATGSHDVGIDRFGDIMNVAIKTGVIVQRGSMYDVPGLDKAIKSKDKVAEYVLGNQECQDLIRTEVLARMAA